MCVCDRERARECLVCGVQGSQVIYRARYKNEKHTRMPVCALGAEHSSYADHCGVKLEANEMIQEWMRLKVQPGVCGHQSETHTWLNSDRLVKIEPVAARGEDASGTVWSAAGVSFGRLRGSPNVAGAAGCGVHSAGAGAPPSSNAKSRAFLMVKSCACISVRGCRSVLDE